MRIINFYVFSSFMWFGVIASCFSSTGGDHMDPLTNSHSYRQKVSDHHMDRGVDNLNKKIIDRIEKYKESKGTLIKTYRIVDKNEEAYIEFITPYDNVISELENLQSKITSKTRAEEIDKEIYRRQEENFPQDDEASEESS
jgi:hypothetical protein